MSHKNLDTKAERVVSFPSEMSAVYRRFVIVYQNVSEKKLVIWWWKPTTTMTWQNVESAFMGIPNGKRWSAFDLAPRCLSISNGSSRMHLSEAAWNCCCRMVTSTSWAKRQLAMIGRKRISTHSVTPLDVKSFWRFHRERQFHLSYQIWSRMIEVKSKNFFVMDTYEEGYALVFLSHFCINAFASSSSSTSRHW